MDYLKQSRLNQLKAHDVLQRSKIVEICESAGCDVHLVGSLRMGLLANHRDIDLHIYSSELTEGLSFALMAEISKNADVVSISCENGLHTDEQCVSWHLNYKYCDGEIWKFDIIHINKGSRYDGYFEKMADRIISRMTAEQCLTVLRLKFETPDEEDIRGVEYYQAVLEGRVSTLEELREWVAGHRANPPADYWMPQ